MPIRVGRKTYKNFASAKRAASRKGIRNPAAYVATIERNIRQRRRRKRSRRKR